MTEVVRVRSDRRRLLGVVVAALLVAGLALWGSTRLAWLRPVFDTPLRGTVPLDVTGADWEPALTALAVLAVAGVAAAVATAGPARRALGGLIALAGVWAVVLGLQPYVTTPSVERLRELSDAPNGGTAVFPVAVGGGSLLAIVGGLLMLAAGIVLVVRGGSLPRLGGRYSTPAARQSRPVRAEVALWDALDAGQDPTVGSTGPVRGVDDPPDSAPDPRTHTAGEA